jgi:prepilin-type N-terminal cleavage/methylation domain-containing protein
MRCIAQKGFTLAELLIALSILGVIATFTIPKVLQSQQNGKYNTMAKEAIATISQAYQMYIHDHSLSTNTKVSDFIPYLNYIKETSQQVDSILAWGTAHCGSPPERCLILHNGGVLHFWDSDTFGGTATTNAILFEFDPDGTKNGQPDGSGHAIMFFLYYNGKIRTYGTIDPNTTLDNGGSPQVMNPWPAQDPSWFSWER